jgi:hypothetical protein
VPREADKSEACARFERLYIPEPMSGCWLWIGEQGHSGYGRFDCGGGRRIAAHRFSLSLSRGPIPPELVVDHLCRNTTCVNPQHLEAVTNWENTLRSTNFIGRNPSKTHCPAGHAYSGANLYVQPGIRKRECRACRKDRDKARLLTRPKTLLMRRLTATNRRARP